MVLKVLLINISEKELEVKSTGIVANIEKIENKPTLHDYHAIVMDVNEIFSPIFWHRVGNSDTLDTSKIVIENFKEQVKEQISTGGITFLFCGKEYKPRIFFKIQNSEALYGEISNYFCSPLDLGVVNGKGETFYIKNEELKYFSPLIKQIPKEEITWECYFSKLPKNSRVIAVNRAGYPVLAEIPLENGKLVLLPRFKDLKRAINIIVNEILPQIIHEDDPVIIPDWLSRFISDYERSTRNVIGEIEKTKRLLYTKDKLLKKAVAFAFKVIGFTVTELPDGTNADLEIFDDGQKAVVEVKGHENRQSDRNDTLQLLGYSTPEGDTVKGVFVSNSEFCKPPEERRKEAFKQGAIDLAIDTKLSLISTSDLYEIVMTILQGKTTPNFKKDIRDKIMKGRGIVSFS